MAEVVFPEQYHLRRTTNVPNNPLPALIYRDVLPKSLDPEQIKDLCEANGWEKRGEWGAITTAHFHPNTHECYAIWRGKSRLVLGRPKGDDSDDGAEIDVSAGDVVVVPAGVSHRSLTSSDGYRYIGVYPKAAPKWRNIFCKGEEPIEKLEEEISKVGLPDSDPVYGLDGPLPQIWKSVRDEHST
ncbi:hypothetical protein BS50DRAFT_210709 [Corynespora cassiicola Philippines]|uniref:Cupin type-1 domain-containing protein n=1 Tax=Corynespora cassiicola Philippines TaxID=1448308 RepID=A0A2T2N414_CORCC|nr:hypothetical protein BS50DRAFT_210709 [Corynespora cassiicola Philippines]